MAFERLAVDSEGTIAQVRLQVDEITQGFLDRWAFTTGNRQWFACQRKLLGEFGAGERGVPKGTGDIPFFGVDGFCE